MTKAYYNIYRSKTKVMNGGLIMVSNEKFYQRIKLLRKESKLTQEQMASYLDVDQSLVTKLENGTRNLNVNLMEKICNLFGCTEEYLLGESDEYIPLNFAFRSNNIQAADLQSIAMINKLAMNLRFMDELMKED